MAAQFLRYRPADCTPCSPHEDPAAARPNQLGEQDAPAITCERQASSCTDKELETLEAMFPRIEWWDKDMGCRWSQGVSDEPATRDDVVRVAGALDQQIKAYNLSQGRICSAREALVLDAFNEVRRRR